MLASNDRDIVNDELEIMWKEEVVACFNVLSHHLPERTEGNQRKSQ
jgi:hypothetical protein